MHGGKWLSLGWQHAVWDLVRLYVSFRGNQAEAWTKQLRGTSKIELGDGTAIPVAPEVINQFFAYLSHREKAFAASVSLLRTEQQALRYCKSKSISVLRTRTKSQEHHQSSKAIVATVAAMVKELCESRGINFNVSPQTRCAWSVNQQLHVTARNIDGAIEHLVNPAIIWEIKEYWGVTGGGSKMSDAVYECNLVGRELREFEERSGSKVIHIVFLDGKAQWESRKSDLKRFIDLTHQGLIDHLFIGKDVENKFPLVLCGLLDKLKPSKK